MLMHNTSKPSSCYRTALWSSPRHSASLAAVSALERWRMASWPSVHVIRGPWWRQSRRERAWERPLVGRAPREPPPGHKGSFHPLKHLTEGQLVKVWSEGEGEHGVHSDRTFVAHQYYSWQTKNWTKTNKIKEKNPKQDSLLTLNFR